MKVELESAEDSTRAEEGLRRKDPESRSLVSGKARSTWFGLELSGPERCVELGIGRVRLMDLQWRLRWCGCATLKILAKIADARRGDSGEACGKHGTQR